MDLKNVMQGMKPAIGRAMGTLETGWCKAVTGGTGITVLTLLLSKDHDISVIQNTLSRIQNDHPLLRSKLHRHPTSNTLSYITSPTPFIVVKELDLKSTASFLSLSDGETPLQKILEYELNENSWRNSLTSSQSTDFELFYAKTYLLPDLKKVLALRFHTSVCDRTTAVSLLRELPGIVLADSSRGNNNGVGTTTKKDGGLKGELNLGVEALMPAGVIKKGLLSRGVNMLGYSLSSLKLSNLNFKDAKQARSSQVILLQLSESETQKY